MPHHYEFDRQHGILLVVIEGEVQDSELLEINDGIRDRVGICNPTAGITDHSGMTSFIVSSEVVRLAARTPPPYKQPIPWFLVAPRDAQFGMARIYQTLGGAQRPKLQVVRSRQEALTALGVQNATFEKVD